MKLELDPIGVVRSPFAERKDAPRQPRVAADAKGTIELRADMADAVLDLDGWPYLWVLFWFHRNESWRPRVTPPRSSKKRGVLATRSPYRPNPLGLSVVRLERVEGRVLHVAELDMLDGTPVFDIKPYLAWSDAIPDAGGGWLDEEEGASTARVGGGRPPDPKRTWSVGFTKRAREQLAWLEARGVALEPALVAALSLGPEPHAYRRIKKDGDAMRIAVKAWRARFRVEGRSIEVLELQSGFRRKERPPLHQDFDTDVG